MANGYLFLVKKERDKRSSFKSNGIILNLICHGPRMITRGYFITFYSQKISILLAFISTSEKNTNDIPPDKVALYEKKKKNVFYKLIV